MIPWLIVIHIISSTLLFGTGLGSAFYFYRANHSQEKQAMYFAAKNVVIADWLFTTPAVIIQPITGFLMVHMFGYSYFSPWLIATYLLYVLTGLCWIPVVWLQIKMRDLLTISINNNSELPSVYHRYYRLWFLLGWPAFIAVMIIFYLMVFRPS